MKSNLSFVILLAWALSASAITIETVPVGEVGNANDPETADTYGSVNYGFNIGKYEVTVGQYTAFLNAVAATDTYALYNTSMATDLNIAGIARSGASGSYSYSAIGSANHPVTYVSWGDAARFANWIQNGQPVGTQNVSTTENGAYTLNGATSDAALQAISRNTSATWVIPTENEWFKAAYYQPAAQGGDADSYWRYPMKTNNEPYSDQPPGTTPENTRVGNFYNDDGMANGFNDGYAVTGSTTLISTQNYLTDVGAYSLSPSFYGTFDQGGNAMEWTESLRSSMFRTLRGGSFAHTVDSMSVYIRHYTSPTSELSIVGFRLAAVPEQSTLVLSVGIFAPLAACRRRRG
jgi:formylglycine-generating enzyme required for sulfatase activity